jgi:dihydropyrimidinase
MFEIAGEVARNGGILMVHVEDEEIVMYMYEKFKREGYTDLEFMPHVHSVISEDLSTRRIIRMAEYVGAALYVAHVNAKPAVDAVAEARAKARPIYGETLVNYLCFTQEVYKTIDGPLYHTYPSLKSEEDLQALWQGVVDGSMSTVATDELLYTRAEKMRSRNIAECAGGSHSVETRLGIMYSEGVVKHGMSLQRFVEVTSTNAARILGLYPQKGVIAPGSDADVVAIDPNVHKRLSLQDLHGSDFSVFDGWEIHGWPVMTVLRGKIVVENGAFLGEPDDGKLVLRKITPQVLSKPVC